MRNTLHRMFRIFSLNLFDYSCFNGEKNSTLYLQRMRYKWVF